MSKSFKGRVVTPGRVKAEALVSHGGFNTLASFQMALMFGDKQVKCGDQNNSDIYKKSMIGKALCLPVQQQVEWYFMRLVLSLSSPLACCSLSQLIRLLPPVRYLRQIGQMRLCR